MRAWLQLAGVVVGLATLSTTPNSHAHPVWPTAGVPAAQIVHGEPPADPDVFCTPTGDVVKGVHTPDSPCHCKNMVGPTPDGECTVPINNDNTCSKFCHEAQCRCPKTCVEPAK